MRFRRSGPWSLALALLTLGAMQACEPGYGTGPRTVWVHLPMWVAGRAVDTTGTPVADASVYLDSDNLDRAGKTGSGGAFAFRGVAKAGCRGFPCPLSVHVFVLDQRQGTGEAFRTLTIASLGDTVRLRTLRLDLVVRLP